MKNFIVWIVLLGSTPVWAELHITIKKFARSFSDVEMEKGKYVNPHVGGDRVFFEQDLQRLGDNYGALGASEVNISDGYLLNFGKPADFDRYLLTPIRFMEAQKKGESCTPIKSIYRCKQGQAYTNTCFLTVAEDGPYPKLADNMYRIYINESKPLFCNEVGAVGLYDSKKNQFLVTINYFPVPQKDGVKNSLSMTVLFEVQKMRSEINLIQDDTCLGNPNNYDTIAKARAALKKCQVKNQLIDDTTASRPKRTPQPQQPRSALGI
jgi:hypothetical protein